MSLLGFALLFAILYASAVIGRRFGKWKLEQHPQHKLGILSVAEAALFTLFALLVAFTFTGAYDRFETRKMQIIDEANAIYSVNLLFDLLDPQQAQILRQDLHHYIYARINTYKKLNIINYETTTIGMQVQSQQILLKIWHESLAALKTKNATATEMLVPALTNLFATANKQYVMSKVHLPVVIFVLLFVLALLSVFLTGYSIARKKFMDKKSIYLISYIAVTTVTLYIITDLELPRLGLIRVTSFDSTILEINQNLLKQSGA